VLQVAGHWVTVDILECHQHLMHTGGLGLKGGRGRGGGACQQWQCTAPATWLLKTLVCCGFNPQQCWPLGDHSHF
jgi:hypothetical protein